MLNPKEPGISEEQRALRQLVSDIASGRYKPLPQPTHTPPERQQ